MDQEEVTQVQEQPLLNLGSLNISEIIKSAQSSNGLKHFDYARYRKYCSLKVKRIRKGLKFTHGKKYQQKDIIDERANEPKMLHVLLFEAEKNWAYAMHLKSLVNQTVAKKKISTRSKFRLRSKLKRALQWSQKLQKVCEFRTEKRTSLESEAYAAQLQGMYNFEIEQWEKATEAYIKCRSIFTEIIKVTDNLQAVHYREKIEQIDQALRYCNHKASRGKNLMTLESILEMKQNIRDPALSQKLEELLDQHRKEQIEQKQGLLDIEYHGEKLPIKNTKVLVLISKVDEMKINITQNKERIQGNEVNSVIDLHDQNLENYISLFSLYDDAIKLVTKDRDEQTNSEAEKSIFTKVLGYLNLQRQVAVLERNEVNIQISIVKFLKEDGVSNLQNLSTKKALKHKLTTPQEIVKHCDNYLQVLRQIMDVERMNPDLSMFKIMNVQESICRALRCFFLACLYFSNFKYQETVSMLKFNEELISAARDKYQENSQLFGKQNVLSVFDFFPSIQPQLLLKCKLNALREQDTSQILIGQQLQTLSVEEQQSLNDINLKSLFHFCKDQDAASILNLDNIQNFRKADLTDLMTLVLPKPIQFDLAYDQIQFPSLEEKKVQQQKSGFWGKLNIFKK